VNRRLLFNNENCPKGLGFSLTEHGIFKDITQASVKMHLTTIKINEISKNKTINIMDTHDKTIDVYLIDISLLTGCVLCR